MKKIIENLQAIVDSIEFAETEYKANYVIETEDKKLLTEALNEALRIHGVMQAEGSDGAKGAAVGIGGWVRGVRDWEEDFAHENGKYLNKCTQCKEMFMGHKRRTRCKICG